MLGQDTFFNLDVIYRYSPDKKKKKSNRSGILLWVSLPDDNKRLKWCKVYSYLNLSAFGFINLDFAVYIIYFIIAFGNGAQISKIVYEQLFFLRGVLLL